MAASSFHYVIVGGGTAGLVVAARLSENPDCRVLVLEAGADNSADPRVMTPALYMGLFNTDADWGFTTVPQAHLEGREIRLNQGKALGGSSAINAEVFVPPAKSLVDAWETLGNTGWNWAALKPYFAKTYTSPQVEEGLKKAMGIGEGTVSGHSDAAAHGPIQTSFPGDASHPLREAWADAFKTTGQAMAHDPFLEPTVGGFSCLASIDPATKQRSYATTAYYHPVKDRKNLQVLTGACVLKIEFAAATPATPVRATAVHYLLNGEPQTVAVGRDVILAAGALQTPKLLELSGIGDAALLTQHGIPVMQHLPGVGENLQDHLFGVVRFRVRDNIETMDPLARQEPEAVGQAMQAYAATQTGLLASAGVYTHAYLPVPEHAHRRVRELLDAHRPQQQQQPNDTTTSPEQQALALALHTLASRDLLDPNRPSAGYLSVVSQTPNPALAPNCSTSDFPAQGQYLSICATLAHPLSRGSVHIASADPLADPAIDPRYLSHPLDEEVLAQHLLHAQALVTRGSSPLSKLLHFDHPPATTTSSEQQEQGYTDAELAHAKQRLRATATTMLHPAGTCAMMARELGGVVDGADLRVYGTANVRVVDASALPLLSTANPQATVYAFAERAAELIKEGN